MDGTTLVTTMLSQLHLNEKSAISLGKTEEDYVLQLDSQTSPQDDKMLAATSSDQTVRLYSRQNLAHVGTISGHKKVISGIRFSPGDSDQIFTCSQDGTVCTWDLRSTLKKPAQTYEGIGSGEDTFTAFDVSQSALTFCVGTEVSSEQNAYLYLWDCRQNEPVHTYCESHNDDITQVCFHPTKENMLISGSTDGYVCVFDCSQSDEDEALLGTLNSESAVSCIGWCGSDSSQIYCLSYTETLHIWDAEEFDLITELTDIRSCTYDFGNLDYLVDCFTTPESQSTYVLAGSNSGVTHMMEIKDQKLEPLFNLPKGHTDRVRCMNFDPASVTLVTGGEDSMLCLWSSVPTAKPEYHKDKRKEKGSQNIKSKMKSSVSRSRPF